MERIQALHPDPEKSGVRILKWKYDVIREAVLSSVPPSEPGLPFRDLAEAVRSRLAPAVLEELGSVPWYTVTVKLDLEARGEIARSTARGPQRLIRLR